MPGKEKQRKRRKWRKRRKNDNSSNWLRWWWWKWHPEAGQHCGTLFLHGLAESTRKTYNLAKRRSSEFASKHGFQSLPASEHQLRHFVSYQAEGKLCHSTIKCYLSAVRQMHVAEGYGDPRMSSMARLEQVLKGTKSLQARTRGRSLPRSAAQNERGVAEKRYHLGQHDAMGSGNPVLPRVLQVQGDHSTSSLSFRWGGSSDIQGWCVRKEDRHQ